MFRRPKRQFRTRADRENDSDGGDEDRDHSPMDVSVSSAGNSPDSLKDGALKKKKKKKKSDKIHKSGSTLSFQDDVDGKFRSIISIQS